MRISGFSSYELATLNRQQPEYLDTRKTAMGDYAATVEKVRCSKWMPFVIGAYAGAVAGAGVGYMAADPLTKGKKAKIGAGVGVLVGLVAGYFLRKECGGAQPQEKAKMDDAGGGGGGGGGGEAPQVSMPIPYPVTGGYSTILTGGGSLPNILTTTAASATATDSAGSVTRHHRPRRVHSTTPTQTIQPGQSTTTPTDYKTMPALVDGGATSPVSSATAAATPVQTAPKNVADTIAQAAKSAVAAIANAFQAAPAPSVSVPSATAAATPVPMPSISTPSFSTQMPSLPATSPVKSVEAAATPSFSTQMPEVPYVRPHTYPETTTPVTQSPGILSNLVTSLRDAFDLTPAPTGTVAMPSTPTATLPAAPTLTQNVASLLRGEILGPMSVQQSSALTMPTPADSSIAMKDASLAPTMTLYDYKAPYNTPVPSPSQDAMKSGQPAPVVPVPSPSADAKKSQTPYSPAPVPAPSPDRSSYNPPVSDIYPPGVARPSADTSPYAPPVIAPTPLVTVKTGPEPVNRPAWDYPPIQSVQQSSNLATVNKVAAMTAAASTLAAEPKMSSFAPVSPVPLPVTTSTPVVPPKPASTYVSAANTGSSILAPKAPVAAQTTSIAGKTSIAKSAAMRSMI